MRTFGIHVCESTDLNIHCRHAGIWTLKKHHTPGNNIPTDYIDIQSYGNKNVITPTLSEVVSRSMEVVSSFEVALF